MALNWLNTMVLIFRGLHFVFIKLIIYINIIVLILNTCSIKHLQACVYAIDIFVNPSLKSMSQSVLFFPMALSAFKTLQRCLSGLDHIVTQIAVENSDLSEILSKQRR